MIEFDKSRVRILAVDDEDSIRNMLGISLKEEGWNVELAANGKLGLEALSKKPFHIVISDIQMPEMSGIQFLEATKAKYPQIEFIIMTSNASLETAMQAIKLGAYDYITKPFENLSVVSKKMMQVSEKILLRQQNAEFTKRLRKASQDLKLLFEMTSQMNGVLDEKALREIVMQWPPKLFQDAGVSAFWFQHEEQNWKVVEQIGSKSPFTAEEKLESLDAIRAKAAGLRSLKEILLKHEDQSDRLFIFEALTADLAELFSHELRTCFEKVMRYQYILSLANRDGLTRLYNHRYFQDRLRQELSQAKRQNGDLSVILTDVDHFKSFNDTRGHPAGDQLLRELAAVFDKENARRGSDIVARYGGEEFIFLLPFTDYQGALVKAERIRAAVEQTKFLVDSTNPAKVTITLGVATFPLHGVSAGHLIEFADKALYQGKAGGRNRVVGYEAVKKSPTLVDEGPKTTLASVLSDVVPNEEKSQSPVVAEKVEAVSADLSVESAIEAPNIQEPLIQEIPPILATTVPEVEAPAVISPVVNVEVPVVEEVKTPEQAPVVAEAPANIEPPASVEVPVETETQVVAEMAKPEKPKFKRKSLGPEVDVEDLYSSLESALERPAPSDADVKTVLFKSEEESKQKSSKGNHGTGTEG